MNLFDVEKHFPKDLKSKLMKTKDTRIVELYKYSSRRQELLKQNKPVATYDHVANIRAPSIFKDNRSVKMWWLTEKLKCCMKPFHRKDRWWIVADTRVLLHDMYFIRDLITSDDTCRMGMPYEVLHDLIAMTGNPDRAWVRIPAKKLLTFIESYEGRNNIIIGQGAIEAEDLLDHPFATDAVLNCCMQYLRFYYYVVLITDDPVRKEKAINIGMPCYSLQEIRDVVLPKYSNHREGKGQITIRFPSVPSAPPVHTMAGPFGHICAANQTMANPLVYATIAPPVHTMAVPLVYTMAGPFGHISAANQTVADPLVYATTAPLVHTMAVPLVHTMTGPFGPVYAASQTITAPPFHTMPGLFSHILPSTSYYHPSYLQ